MDLGLYSVSGTTGAPTCWLNASRKTDYTIRNHSTFHMDYAIRSDFTVPLDRYGPMSTVMAAITARLNTPEVTQRRTDSPIRMDCATNHADCAIRKVLTTIRRITGSTIRRGIRVIRADSLIH